MENCNVTKLFHVFTLPNLVLLKLHFNGPKVLKTRAFFGLWRLLGVLKKHLACCTIFYRGSQIYSFIWYLDFWSKLKDGRDMDSLRRFPPKMWGKKIREGHHDEAVGHSWNIIGRCNFYKVDTKHHMDI